MEAFASGVANFWPDSKTPNPKTLDADVGIAFRFYVAQLQMKGNSFLVRSFYSEPRVQLVCVLPDPVGHHLLRESFPPFILDDESDGVPRARHLPNTLCPNTLSPNKKAQVFSSPAIEKQPSFVFFRTPEEKSLLFFLDDGLQDLQYQEVFHSLADEE